MVLAAVVPAVGPSNAANAGTDGTSPAEETVTSSTTWRVRRHGACCEGNLAATKDTTVVLEPRLLTGNRISRSDDAGRTWDETYPPVGLSVPFGIEGDLQAHGDDVVFFGTEVSHGVAARSTDRGRTWTVTQIPVAWAANDQAWLYMGPTDKSACPVQTEPYVLAGWYTIGDVLLFSCDGGRTWPVQTPMPGLDEESFPVPCQVAATPPVDEGDTRIADADFARMQSGRRGGWGTDGRLYWAQVTDGDLYVCWTDDLGATWQGTVRPTAAGTARNVPVQWLAFDDRGTLYVLHADKLYVSTDRGSSFAFVHDLPVWGDDADVRDHAGQHFVVRDGDIHVGVRREDPDGRGHEIGYLRGTGVDTASPTWTYERVDGVGNPRLDFMQIALDGSDRPTLGYTSRGDTTTATRADPV